MRQEAFAAGAARLGLQELVVVGKAYEGQVPTARMLAGAQGRLGGGRRECGLFGSASARAADLTSACVVTITSASCTYV